MHHLPPVSHDALWCLTKLCSQPVRSREKPLVPFFVLLLTRKCCPVDHTAASMLGPPLFTSWQRLPVLPQLNHDCRSAFSPLENADWCGHIPTSKKQSFKWECLRIDPPEFIHCICLARWSVKGWCDPASRLRVSLPCYPGLPSVARTHWGYRVCRPLSRTVVSFRSMFWLLHPETLLSTCRVSESQKLSNHIVSVQ